MKKSITLLALSFAFIAITSCSKKTEVAEGSVDADEWAQMDSFHMIMAEAFHPYKDSTNLEPARKLAEEMAAEAAKWQSESIPEKVNNEEVKALLDKLKAGTREFADGVSSDMTDDELGKRLNSLHDNFHSIMEAWHGAGHKMEH